MSNGFCFKYPSALFPDTEEEVLLLALCAMLQKFLSTCNTFTVIESQEPSIYGNKYGVQMIMRFNEIHKFSDDTLHQIDEALDYRSRNSSRKPTQLRQLDACYHDLKRREHVGPRLTIHMEAILHNKGYDQEIYLADDLKECSKITQNPEARRKLSRMA
ncbi:hypothetical protein Tco_0184532 [Tanacetum coccineum]|uniref:Uncharacterized protein n=1 Tax=Tanacetum coccineum TaxID=301880 RepID=A0ABQ5FQE0_9ASTR